MIILIFILFISFYIFISAIYIIEPGKNAKQDGNTDLDKCDDETYIDEVTD